MRLKDCVLSMSIELTFLGTGTSQGVPVIGCDCAVCHSADRRDRRYRTSGLLHLDGHNVLIDATPELRLQCLENDVRRVDAVLVTHTHADHVFGLDDMRRFNQLQGEVIGLYADAEHLAELDKVFGYARGETVVKGLNLPRLRFEAIEGPFALFGRQVVPLRLRHGQVTSLGFRVGGLAYCTDLSEMSDEVVEQIKGVEVLVLGALRHKRHPTHLSIEQAVALSKRVEAQQTWFVHLTHDVCHGRDEAALPGDIRLAYDGLRIRV